MNFFYSKERLSSTRSNSNLNDAKKKHNFINKHFEKLTHQKTMTWFFVELIPGKAHEKLLSEWEKVYRVFHSEWIHSPIVSIGELRRQMRWPDKTDPPMNFFQVLVRLTKQKKFLLVNQRSLKWNYNQCLAEIYQRVSAEFDEHITNKKNSVEMGNFSNLEEKDFFLVNGSLSRKNFRLKTQLNSGLFSTLSQSLLNFIGSKSSGSFSNEHIFDPKKVRREDFSDPENLILNVDYCKELVKTSRLKMDQVFCYSKVLPRELFVPRLKEALGVSDETAIDCVILFLQFEKQFNWDVFKNHFFFYKRDWHFEESEIQQQLSILSIMNSILEIQNLSKQLNDSVQQIERLKKGNRRKSFFISIRNARDEKIKMKVRILQETVKTVNFKLRSLARECFKYDEISAKIYKSDQDILWTASTRGLHNSSGISTEQGQPEPIEEINEFQTGENGPNPNQPNPNQSNSNRANSNQQSSSAKNSKRRRANFQRGLDLLFMKNEELIKKYFGDVKKGFRHSTDFDFQTFRKILSWLRKVEWKESFNVKVTDYNERHMESFRLGHSNHQMLIETLVSHCWISLNEEPIEEENSNDSNSESGSVGGNNL